MISKSLRRIVQTMKSSRVRYAAIFASLVLVLVFGAVQANGPMRPPHPPQPPQNDGMWGMKMPMWGMKMPKWRPWMPWVPAEPVPKIHIIAVFEDLLVFFETEDFPEDQDFMVTMGEMYTQGKDGIEIGVFNSEDGSPKLIGAYIPAELYGLDRISIRAQTDHQYPYYAYNWFFNTTALAPDYAAIEGMSADEAKFELQSTEGLIELDSLEVASVESESAAEAPAAEAPVVETESTDDAAAETEGTEGVGGADAVEEAAAGSELTGVTWQWTGFSDPVQGDLTIDTPEQYTVLFTPEGLAAVKADCNNGNGTYIADEEGGIDIAIGIVTAAACAPESLSDQFLEYLGEVAVYTLEDDGGLAFDLPADGGTMSFVEGEAAAPAEGEAEAPAEGEAETTEEGEAEAPAEGEAETTEEGEADAPAEGEETEAAEEGEAAASVTGTVTYMQRIALPDDAVITVQIQDTSLADAPAVVMGEQIIEPAGQQVPIPYEVTYNPDEIEDNHTYTMSARIEDSEGNLLFINDTAIPVITRDSPTEDVEIMTVQVAATGEAEVPAEGDETEAAAEGEETEEAEAPAEDEAQATEEDTSLTGVVWQWTDFSDPVQGDLPVENPEQYTVEFLEDGTAGVKLDCNSGSGSYIADEEGGIDITIGAVTLALCTEDSLGDQFQQYLDAAAVYSFEDGDLLLDLPVDSGTLRFAAAEATEAGATAKLASITTMVAAQPVAGGDDEMEEEESTVPSFTICSVVRDETVYIVGENFPADQTFAVKMGVAQTVMPMYKHPMQPKPMPYQAPMKQGPMKPSMGMPGMGPSMKHPGNMWMKPAPKVWIPYYEAGTLETGEGGEVEGTFDIPAELAGAYKISIMMRTDQQFPYISYNWFYNNTADVCNGENGES